jgi:thiamine biosynthesis lipoprotein
LAELLQHAIGWAGATGGAFNPLVGPIIEAWHTRAEGAVPSSDAINAAAARASLSNAVIAGNVVRLANNAEFEEGAFGKGYAIDRMLAQIDSPPAVINFGGQLAVRGEARVTIADPDRRDVPVLALTIRDASLSTSSGSEKTFECGGVRFTHIVDPRTGRALPPRGSVSVVATSAFDADVLSTALYVMDAGEGLRWAGAHGVNAIFITSQRDVRVSAAARRAGIQILDHQFKLKD